MIPVALAQAPTPLLAMPSSSSALTAYDTAEMSKLVSRCPWMVVIASRANRGYSLTGIAVGVKANGATRGFVREIMTPQTRCGVHGHALAVVEP